MQREILYLNIGNFSVSIEQHLHPDLKGRPVIVGMPKGNSSGVVVSASREARKFGISENMSIRRAQRICSDAVVMQADFAVYRQVFDDFLTLCSRYSPLLEPDTLGCAWMDVTGSRNLFGRPIDIANAIAREVSERLGLSMSFGCASNKLVAKIASSAGRKFTRIMPGGERGFLKPLPVSKLDAVNAKIGKRLTELGISKIGELEQIPEDLLVRQFGSIGSVIKRQSMGHDFTPVRAAYPPEVIMIEHMCDPMLCEPVDVECRLTKIVSELARKLDISSALAGELTLTLFDESKPGSPVAIPAYYRFKKPTRSAYVIIQALGKLVASKMQAGLEISRVRVVLSDLSREGGHQLCIIESGRDKERLEKAVEQINDRFGDDAVFLAAGLVRGRRGQFLARDIT
ncbi:MAG: DNA polymerase Y family protein [Armatimonadota bacterium]